MRTARLLDIDRWRALLGLLWSAGRGRALCLGALRPLSRSLLSA